MKASKKFLYVGLQMLWAGMITQAGPKYVPVIAFLGASTLAGVLADSLIESLRKEGAR